MIKVENTLVSDDLIKEEFVCNLSHCKGACCVEGDLGAPLEMDELEKIDAIIEQVKPYLSQDSINILEEEGAYVLDEEGDYSTTTIEGKECVFAFYDDNRILKCGIEQSYKDKKIDFKKPISCHLYPIRISVLPNYEALNYDRWNICSSACTLGQELKIPVYKFLEEALVRRYGETWYKKLIKTIQSLK